MATFEKGDAFDDVGQIQQALGIGVDGRFGPRMVVAVKVWQKSQGVEATGQVGPDMLLALGLVDLVILENGDSGDLVRRVQDELGLEVDGQYGDATEDAVRAYQKKNRLKATGSADTATLQAMGVLAEGAPAPAEAAPAAVQQAPEPAPAKTRVQAPPPVAAAPPPQATSGTIERWAYQLADIKPAEIAALPVDLAVIDYAADGADATAFTRADTTAMKQRPDGGSKKLISYMSIGEAEDYRYYWQPSWNEAATRPAWLDDLNPDWQGNYKVRFWDPAWQAVILGSPNAYLDRIIAAGFDGVYLDIIDAFEYWQDVKPERPSADKDMIAFVTRIAKYARSKRPDFMIIPQNGEALLADAGYRAVISAQAKEDIFYGQDGDGRANKKAAVEECLGCLAHARDAGLPILAVEYLKDDKKINDAQAKLANAGCTAYFGPRALDDVPEGQFKG